MIEPKDLLYLIRKYPGGYIIRSDQRRSIYLKHITQIFPHNPFWIAMSRTDNYLTFSYYDNIVFPSEGRVYRLYPLDNLSND